MYHSSSLNSEKSAITGTAKWNETKQQQAEKKVSYICRYALGMTIKFGFISNASSSQEKLLRSRAP